MNGRPPAFAVMAAVVLLAAQSEAAVLCRQGTGKLIRRETCRRAEQVLDASRLDLSALAGVQGAPGASGPRGQHPLRLVDGVGIEIGSLQAIQDSDNAFVLVTHPALTVQAQFLVGRAGFVRQVAGSNNFVGYTSPDCAGVPYMGLSLVSVVEARVFGTAAYYPSGPEQSRNLQSSEIDDRGEACGGGGTATGRGTCCSNINVTNNLAPAVRVPIADLGFIPPFRAVPR